MIFRRMILKMAKQVIIFKCNMQSVVTCRGKDEYHSQLAQKLSDPSASSKTCWYIFKWLYNEKKLPNIPPLSINNKRESDFKIIGNYFNSFLASESTLFVNSSTAPNLPQYISASRLLLFCFNEEVILNFLILLALTRHMETMINQSNDQVK